MDARIDNWDDLRLFLAVARAGTLSGAAREIGVAWLAGHPDTPPVAAFKKFLLSKRGTLLPT